MTITIYLPKWSRQMVDFQSSPVQNPFKMWFYNPVQSKSIWIGLDFQSGGLIRSISYSGSHRTRHCSGPVCDGASASRPVPSKPSPHRSSPRQVLKTASSLVRRDWRRFWRDGTGRDAFGRSQTGPEQRWRVRWGPDLSRLIGVRWKSKGNIKGV